MSIGVCVCVMLNFTKTGNIDDISKGAFCGMVVVRYMVR